MNDLTYEQTTEPAIADIAAVRSALQAFNITQAGEFPRQPLAVFARDGIGTIVGGAVGELHWGWLYIDLLWVDELRRRQGIGRTLLQRIESMADDYNVTGYHLGTTSFQGLAFYERCGYRVWGTLKDFPPGHTNYSLARRAQDKK